MMKSNTIQLNNFWDCQELATNKTVAKKKKKLNVYYNN